VKPLFQRAAAVLAAVSALSCAACSTTSAPKSAPGTSAHVRAPARIAGEPDPMHGRVVFATNCQSCHGAAGAGGGIGPSLRAERSRKNLTDTIAWIRNPQPPMPKLYPATLSQKDVIDVAAYVQSL
jgi:mono/diheme cytochrome c family protein